MLELGVACDPARGGTRGGTPLPFVSSGVEDEALFLLLVDEPNGSRVDQDGAIELHCSHRNCEMCPEWSPDEALRQDKHLT